MSCHILSSPLQMDSKVDHVAVYTYVLSYIGLSHHHLEDAAQSSITNINSYLGYLHSDIFLFPVIRCCEGLLYILVQYYILEARSLVLWSNSARTTREQEPHTLIIGSPLSKLSYLFPLFQYLCQVYYEIE